jgi:hypothetical protein
MKKILAAFLFFPFISFAQPNLGPHIGINSLPQNSDPICTIPVYTGNMYASGYFEGDTVPDFTLYKTNGDSVRLSSVLAAGKPVLLVAGNYTCPVFREKIADLNAMAAYYAGQLEIYIVYGVEAHPIVDPSPYSGIVWTTSDNYSEGVLFEQPDTYGERLALIDSMLDNYTIIPEILVDGPCNPWWTNFGPAPNNAYLIDTNGIVSAKHGWFHRTPDNMWCEIDSLLGTSSGNCIIAGNNGAFSVTLDNGDSSVTGTAGNVLEIHMTITNNSLTDNVELNISKYQMMIPTGWQTALCLDICYTTSVTSANVTIAPQDTQPFTFYFYTNSVADTGYARIRFINLNDSTNMMDQRLRAITENANSVDELNKTSFKIHPNPTEDQLFIHAEKTMIGEQFIITDLTGRIIYSGMITHENIVINTKEFSKGIYVLRVGNSTEKFIKN